MSNDFLNDDLSDLLGNDAPAAPRALPQDETFARIRETVPQFVETCPSCRGTGRFVSYSGRTLGRCFKCKGRGSKTFATSPETRMQNRTKAAQRKERTAETNWADFAERHPEMAAFMTAEAAKAITSANERWIDMVRNFVAGVRRYGQLTQGQQGVIERALARRAQQASQKAQGAAQQQARVAGIDVANIVDAFQRASEAGLKRFTLRFENAHFQSDRNDPTLIWVSQGGYGTARYGRIVGGVFKPGRDATDAVLAQIAGISKDPMAAAIAYAQVTSSCSVCGRHLENQDSVDAGIGPVCAGRINRPGLKFERVEAGSF
jgi:hypothetical protein